MLLSIIIVAKDEETYIVKCLDSIFIQLLNIGEIDCEIIFVDSLSEDETVSLAKKKLEDFGEVPYKILSNNGISLAKGWNLGIKNSSGKYVLRPDAHAEFNSNYIDIGLTILEEDASIDAVGGVLDTRVGGLVLPQKGLNIF